MAIGKSTGTRAGSKTARVDHARFRRAVRELPNGGRTLVLDNDRQDLVAIAQKLKIVLGPEAEVLAAQDAAKAVDRLVEQPARFDLVLLNHGLGRGMTGLDLLAVIRNTLPEARFRLVLYSSAMDAELAAKAAKAGFDLAVHADELDSMVSISRHLWSILKPNIDWSASWRGLP